ncbi:MAG: hypothetical protein ACYS99_04240 [Planctomycetota bacterium]|jgi:UDP-3-O-[3-hydroxymyristoyl] glucosamine N-acyltransferase
MAKTGLGVDEILEAIRPLRADLLGDRPEVSIVRLVPLKEAGGPDSATFAGDPGEESMRLLEENGSPVAIVGPEWEAGPPGVLLLRVRDPRLAAARLLRCLHPEVDRDAGIHPQAVVSPAARVAEGVVIGPFAVIGDAEIGPGCRIGAGAQVGDGCRIGANVRIDEGATVGTRGFGFVRNEEGRLEHFPQVGGVILEDGVEVFAQANVDRGTLGDTRIGAGSKIDHHAHVSHNCDVGRDTLVCAHAILGGGSTVGDRCFIGLGAAIREKRRVGDDAVVGMNAVVARDVPTGATVAGVPARPLRSDG